MASSCSTCPRAPRPSPRRSSSGRADRAWPRVVAALATMGLVLLLAAGRDDDDPYGRANPRLTSERRCAMTIERWDPFREAVSLRDAMNTLLQESFVRPTGLSGPNAPAALPLDV